MTQTIFGWQSELAALIIITVSVGVAYLSAPAASAAKTAEILGVTIVDPEPLVESRHVPSVSSSAAS